LSYCSQHTEFSNTKSRKEFKKKPQITGNSLFVLYQTNKRRKSIYSKNYKILHRLLTRLQWFSQLDGIHQQKDAK
jgi:hypothetical protein